MDTKKRLSGIRVIIWDFDGTLYRSIPKLSKDIIEADYKVVMHHTGWDREKTVEEFHKVYKVRTPSSTEATAILADISVKEAAIECEDYKDRRPYLSRDGRLIEMFAELSHFRHFMLVNGVQQKTRECLDVLGVSPETFEEIVTAEVVHVNKPQPNGFQHILDQTKLSPQEHVMVGDREPVDLLPAKALGVKTCLVWKDKPGVVADVTVQTVYDVPGVIE